MNVRLFLLCVGISLFSVQTPAADWPQWRGPERNGILRETGLLQQWPAEGPKLLWQIEDLGSGYSTPAVVGDRLYVCANEGMEDEFVRALSVADGKRIWSTRIGSVGENRGQDYPGARSTPTVDGQVVYALGSNGDLVCLESTTGKPRWQRNLQTDFGGRPGNWAYAESPLVDGDVLVCTPGGSEATLVALNKNTGDVIWKSAVPGGEEAAYSSTIIVETGGVKQYVQFLQKGLVGVDAATGKFLWRYDRTAVNSPANIPTPVAGDALVFSSNRRGAGGGVVELKVNQGEVTAEEVYFKQKVPHSIGGSVLLNGYLYGTTSQAMVCVDFSTGELKWEERGIGAGAVCFADNRLYVHGEENGDVALVEATPEAYREHGRFTPPGEPQGKGKAWTYPVLANGKLYVREQGFVWCYDVKK
ncbi:MAG: PQQ-like beta-propeller repeat protein [Planctomycetes bacterium]|nr:PQQ-like beta-propeller repeat protein [Planctomycetota bacterium]